ncbi:acetyl-CoA synthetase-like protein [Biscogniauxia sp. FL1348]|nr:acetyl-CoA synthetase-like protein [Biscogniauxia sp. FL1348]
MQIDISKQLRTMSGLTKGNDSICSPDRSNCIFPASSSVAWVSGKGTVKVDIIQPQRDVPTIPLETPYQTLAKAAWFLTLQCFIVADTLCFQFSGTLNANQDQAVRPLPSIYITRINNGETVRSFLQRLARSHDPLARTAHLGYSIDVVDIASSRHRCNTELYFYEGKGEVENGDITPLDPNDLRLVVTRTDSQEYATLEYNMAHTSEDMATSVLFTFHHLYSQLANTPDYLTLGDLDICPHSDWNEIRKSTLVKTEPVSQCLHDLILYQCQAHPDEIAVCSWDGNLTYRELDNLSIRVAHHLRQLGVGPEVFVLSCFEKSTWAIVARLAILRAGGAYISIHASNPPAYLQSVITRTKTRILLTDTHHVQRFRGTVPVVVEMSPEWICTLPLGSSGKVCEGVRPDNACLVLFTSGSTGTPKGIVQTHQAYATAIRKYAQQLGLDRKTRYFQFDDYAFDISNLEFLVPLIVGGCCCVPGPMRTAQDLSREINTLKANIIFLTPTVAIKMDPRDVPGLEIMCVGGEPLPKDLVAKWNGSATKLVNQYGMGEVAICCALNEDIDPAGGAKIGRPPTGAIWVVDPSSPDRLMPIGAVGELLIEGPHLARGYLDQTATRHTEAGFLAAAPRWMRDMHPDRGATRIYRSGDLGRRNRDGTVTYLGRKDTILKLDGCRVDALEVEHQARRCLSDADTVVVDLLGVVGGQEDPSLTAFVHLGAHPRNTEPVAGSSVPVLRDTAEDAVLAAKAEQIKAAVAEVLPRYMVPTTFVLMSWVPRTASKKIDRKKIRALGQAFYLARLKQRSKDVSYAQRIQTLPI